MKRLALVVDDDPTTLQMVQLWLEEAGMEVIVAGTGAAALQAVEANEPSVVVLDLHLPDMTGVDVLDAIRNRSASLPVVFMTADEEVEVAVECMRHGATDFLQKPLSAPRLTTTVENAMRQGMLSRQLDAVSEERRRTEGLGTLLGESPAIKGVKELVAKAVNTDVTFLVQGESGTGKEVLAKAIHAESARAAGPFISVNCGAIPEALVESELFGHEKGAFTGADTRRLGLFEQAQGGTVFLDEIGELRGDTQVQLLRVLQERVVKSVGSSVERPVDVRVLAATNRDLRAEVDGGRFREDLFYRLAVFPVTLPALRERGEDVLLLAEHFLIKSAEAQGKRVLGMSSEVERALLAYRWPGNVRQLQNVIQRAVILTEGYELSLRDLSDEVLCSVCGTEDASHAEQVQAPRMMSLEATDIRPLAEVERAAIEAALAITNWNIKETAERLEIGRATLYRRIHQYGLERVAEPEAVFDPKEDYGT